MAAEVDWKISATAGSRIQVITEFVKTSTEAGSAAMALEAPRRSVTALDPAMVLLDPIIQIPVGPVFHSVVQFGPTRAWVTVVTIRRDTRGNDGTCQRL